MYVLFTNSINSNSQYVSIKYLIECSGWSAWLTATLSILESNSRFALWTDSAYIITWIAVRNLIRQNVDIDIHIMFISVTALVQVYVYFLHAV